MSKFNQYLEAAKQRIPGANRMSAEKMFKLFSELPQYKDMSEESRKKWFNKINHSMCKSNAEINDGYPHGIKRWLKSKGIK